jgi:hypothetical protein
MQNIEPGLINLYNEFEQYKYDFNRGCLTEVEYNQHIRELEEQANHMYGSKEKFTAFIDRHETLKKERLSAVRTIQINKPL